LAGNGVSRRNWVTPGLIYSARDSEDRSPRIRRIRGRERERGGARERERGKKVSRDAGEEELTFGLAVGDQDAFYDTAGAFSAAVQAS